MAPLNTLLAACTPACCTHTCVLHAHLCAACTPVCCMHTCVLHAHLRAACTPVCCMHTCVLHAHLCAACTPVCCMRTCVLHEPVWLPSTPSWPHAHLCTAYPPVCCMHTCVLRTHLRAACAVVAPLKTPPCLPVEARKSYVESVCAVCGVGWFAVPHLRHVQVHSDELASDAAPAVQLCEFLVLCW